MISTRDVKVLRLEKELAAALAAKAPRAPGAEELKQELDRQKCVRLVRNLAAALTRSSQLSAPDYGSRGMP